MIIDKKRLLFALLFITFSSAKAMRDHNISLINSPARRRLDFSTAQTTPQQPSPKKAHIESKNTQIIKVSDGVLSPEIIFFSTPNLIARMARFLPLADILRLARISKTCNIATKLEYLYERGVARLLIADQPTPIKRLLLDTNKAQNEQAERVSYYGVACRPKPLADALQYNGASLLSELNGYNEQTLASADEDLPAIPCLVTPKNPFSDDELINLKPTKHFAVESDEETEAQLISRLTKTCSSYRGHMITLDLSPSDDLFFNGEITDSLIYKLAQFPIISLHCEGQSFPQGIGCLGALHQLRDLSIIDCQIEGENIPDELCKKLPFLIRLEINHSQIRTVSPLIDNLKHLTVLSLVENPLLPLPQSLRNLPQLKTINFSKINPLLTANDLANALPNLHNTRHLGIAYNETGNPFPAHCDLNQLQTLNLISNTLVLPEEIRYCRSLENLRLQTPKIISLPLWLTQLPALKQLTGQIQPTLIIDYKVLSFIASQIEVCRLFTVQDNPLNKIRKIAKLWQLIQTNLILIEDRLSKIDDASCRQCEKEIVVIKWFSRKTINARVLCYLIKNMEKVDNCFSFIQKNLLANNSLSSGLKESALASKPYNEHFKHIISTMGRAICCDIPVYSYTNPDDQKSYINEQLIHHLRKTTQLMQETIQLIDTGTVITNAQFNKCRTPLKLILSDTKRLGSCSIALANLFFLHAIARNDITNAEIMLRKGANINYFIPGTRMETALHIVVEKRLKETDLTRQAELDHVICFLVKQNASLEQKNSSGKSAMDLIPEDHPLGLQITNWSHA